MKLRRSTTDAAPQAGEMACHVPLTQLRPGNCAHISHVSVGDETRAILHAMGLRENARIEVCRLGEPCIVRIMGGCGCDSRIGLSRPLADRLFVGPASPRDTPAPG